MILNLHVNTKTQEDLNFEENATGQNKHPQIKGNLLEIEINNTPKNKLNPKKQHLINRENQIGLRRID